MPEEEPIDKNHELVKAKIAAGLPLDDAIAVAKRQIACDQKLKAETAPADKKSGARAKA